VTHLTHLPLPPHLGQAGEQAERRNEALSGQGADRCLLGIVEFDTSWRDSEKHGDHAVATGEPADCAAVAVDQHDELPSTPNVPT